jgi:hypothetical protein
VSTGRVVTGSGGAEAGRSEFVVGGVVVTAGTIGGADIAAGGGDGAGGGVVATTVGVGSLVIAAGVDAVRSPFVWSCFCHIL